MALAVPPRLLWRHLGGPRVTGQREAWGCFLHGEWHIVQEEVSTTIGHHLLQHMLEGLVELLFQLVGLWMVNNGL